MSMFRRHLSTSVRCPSPRVLLNRPGQPAAEATRSVLRTEFERAVNPGTFTFNGWQSKARPLAQGQRVIVELEAKATDAFGKREDPHAALFERLDRFGVPYKIRRKHDSDVFTGVSLTLPSAADVAALKGLEGVKSVLPVLPVFRRPVNRRRRKDADAESSALLGADKDAEQHD